MVFAGKVPVNLNFTLGPTSAASCLKKADIDCLLTTERVRQKMPNFPWPETGVVDLVEELKTLPKAKTLALLSWIHLCPAKLLARILKIPSRRGRSRSRTAFHEREFRRTKGSGADPPEHTGELCTD